MSEEYGNDYVTLIDENGREIELEHLDTLEYKGNTYFAFIPAEMELEESYELIIMKIEVENGEEILVTPDSDIYDEAFDHFMELVEQETLDEPLDGEDEV